MHKQKQFTMKKSYPLIFLLLFYVTANAQYVQKITSINYYGYNGLNPSNLTVFNGKLFFFGTDDLHYVDKLMYTPDGSAAGVTVVKQIDTIKQWPSLKHLTILGNSLIFNNATQLWKSDGTATGTVPIATLAVGSPNFVVLNNRIFFAGDATQANPMRDQLWATDGTAAGTMLVKTINPGGPSGISHLFVSGGRIYFSANDGVNMNQFWVSDGTAAGTAMVKKLNPSGETYPNYFTELNGKVFFAAEDGVNGTQLWKSDGTAAGTQEITTINGAGGAGLQPSTFTVFNSKLYFMGIDRGAFYQLWSTDGTTAGTTLVKADHTPRVYSGFLPTSMAVHKDKLYLSGYDSLTGTNQLWATDGTTAGTVKITGFAHGLNPANMYSFKNKLIMTGNDTISNETQLFATDGTTAGTVCPTPPDTWGQYPFYPWEAWVPFNDALYFKAAYSYFADYQLCRYTENPSGIEQPAETGITVYPNPSDGVFNVVLPLPVAGSVIEVYDSKGIRISGQRAEKGNNAINLAGYPGGLYLVKVVGGLKVVATQKIMKK